MVQVTQTRWAAVDDDLSSYGPQWSIDGVPGYRGLTLQIKDLETPPTIVLYTYPSAICHRRMHVVVRPDDPTTDSVVAALSLALIAQVGPRFRGAGDAAPLTDRLIEVGVIPA